MTAKAIKITNKAHAVKENPLATVGFSPGVVVWDIDPFIVRVALWGIDPFIIRQLE